MEQHKDHHLQQHDDEEQEEALSLCDLPLNDDDDEQMEHSGTDIHSRRSSEPPEFFEFFNNLTSEMSSAEDIIFHGKLVPFKHQTTHLSDQNQENGLSIIRRRSESLSGLQQYSSVCGSNSINNTKFMMMRSSRSLDYRRLERFSSSKTSSSESEGSIDRNSSSGSVGRCESVKRTVKPRWYVLMFGVVKPPAEMELSDIKSRQFRRNFSKKPPPAVSKSSSYKLLKVLSCRDNTSVAVTTPFCIPPPV
ncbi:hypothetical protein M5689_023154 [Euphorbia peplus]|nr:hypothetical protein M5689_023154 [Euphorbia peplus]